jgi:hypothetical protein
LADDVVRKSVSILRVVDSIEKRLRICYNNEPSLFYPYNNKLSGVAKFIDIKRYVVNKKIQDQTIKIEHIRTHPMLADSLTKSLTPNVFR